MGIIEICDVNGAGCLSLSKILGQSKTIRIIAIMNKIYNSLYSHTATTNVVILFPESIYRAKFYVKHTVI
jgi:hypothetical protein